MRLFAALYPPPAALGHLAAAVAAADPALRALEIAGGALRMVPEHRWHVTVAFYGEDDADARIDKLARRIRKAQVAAPWLRCTGAGTFGGVLYVGVRPAEGRRRELTVLARACGADPHQFRPHITVARWSKGRPDRQALAAPLRDYAGPWWQAGELVLVRSELGGPSGPTYTVLHRVALAEAVSGTPDEPREPRPDRT